jgi:hypothetical protein
MYLEYGDPLPPALANLSDEPVTVELLVPVAMP